MVSIKIYAQKYVFSHCKKEKHTDVKEINVPFLIFSGRDEMDGSHWEMVWKHFKV